MRQKQKHGHFLVNMTVTNSKTPDNVIGCPVPHAENKSSLLPGFSVVCYWKHIIVSIRAKNTFRLNSKFIRNSARLFHFHEHVPLFSVKFVYIFWKLGWQFNLLYFMGKILLLMRKISLKRSFVSVDVSCNHAALVQPERCQTQMLMTSACMLVHIMSAAQGRALYLSRALHMGRFYVTTTPGNTNPAAHQQRASHYTTANLF